MKILLTADPGLTVPPEHYGGIERIVASLAGEFRRAGHAVGLVATAGSPVEVDAFFPWPSSHPASRLAHAANSLHLTRSAGKFRPDVLHSFSRLGYLLPLLPGRLPKIMSYQREVGARQVSLANRLARGSLAFTGCSEHICRLGRRGGGDWSAVHNFVELATFPFVESVPADAPLVFLSRIEKIKGTAVAIEIARAAGRRLLIAGNHFATGEAGDYWRDQVAPEIGRNGIEYVGEVNDAQKAELLGRAAALLVPIQWDEPFGIVFAEALACGTPVISCPRGALPEIVEPGKTGFLINTSGEGVQAIAGLSAIARADCRRAAQVRFSAEFIADEYRQLYERRIAGHTRKRAVAQPTA